MSSPIEPAPSAAPPESAPAPKRRFSLTILNFWLDAALFLAITFVMWVSVLLQVVFPSPTSADGWMLWGFSYNQWRDAQFTGLCVCAGLAIEHLVLHWNWVCNVIATKVLRVKTRPDEGSQAIYGVGTFITVLLVILGTLIVALLTVREPAG